KRTAAHAHKRPFVVHDALKSGRSVHASSFNMQFLLGFCAYLGNGVLEGIVLMRHFLIRVLPSPASSSFRSFSSTSAAPSEIMNEPIAAALAIAIWAS